MFWIVRYKERFKYVYVDKYLKKKKEEESCEKK